MKRKALLIAAAIAVATLFVAAGIYAATTAPDVIEMNAGYKHKKGIVEFTHKKHIEEHKLACAECHHDAEGKPRTDMKMGDEVKGCFDCHEKPGELKGRKAKGLSDAEKLEYHANAMHENCKGCHKAYNKKNKTKAAPTTCTKCHPRKKK